MADLKTEDRLALKTPEAAFEQVLQQEYNFSKRLSGALMQTAQEMLGGSVPAEAVRAGQMRLLVASLRAPFGPPLKETEQVAVTLTVDAGREDATVKASQGLVGQRKGRILRLLEEGLAQGGVLSQEDLARALQVDVRTIRRDVRALKQAGHVVLTRGQVKGVGRGQSHKVRIIEWWLEREGYDQIARRMYHSPQAIKRYVSTFLRVVVLHRQETALEEIAFLTQSSVRLVQDYLAVYEAALQAPHRAEKLQEELSRVSVRERSVDGERQKGGPQP